jgi:hypothetical protein
LYAFNFTPTTNPVAHISDSASWKEFCFSARTWQSKSHVFYSHRNVHLNRMTIATAISIRNLSPSASGRSQAIFKPNQKHPIARQTIVRSLCLATQHPTSNKHAMQSLGFCLVSPCLRTSSFINHHLAATAPESSQPCPEYRIRPHLMRVPWLVHSHRSAQVNQTRENPTLEINRSTSPALQPCCKLHGIALHSVVPSSLSLSPSSLFPFYCVP